MSPARTGMPINTAVEVFPRESVSYNDSEVFEK